MITNDRQHRKILIVEDDAITRMVGIDLLEDAGFEVLGADSADEAMAVLETAQVVELLFTDIDMPGSMNGMELAEHVHRRWPNIRLLVTSGHHKISDADVPDAGRFVSKPYSSVAIINQITDLLHHR